MAKTELEKIAERIRARKALDKTDRARQRELIRQALNPATRTHTWSELEAEAGVSRATIRDALSRED